MRLTTACTVTLALSALLVISASAPASAADDVAPLAMFLATLPDHGPSGQTFSLMGRDG